MQSSTDRLLGISLIFAVSLIWILASYVVQYLEDHTVSPFFITFVCNTLFLIFLPIVWIQRTLSRKFPSIFSASYEAVRDSGDEGTQLVVLDSLTDKDIFHLATKIAPLWWCALFTFNLSLDMTSVSSNTILSTTSSLFTFALSVLILKESFFLYKLLSVVLCFSGVVLVALSDQEKHEDEDAEERPLLGDIICVVSALLYASYTIVLKKEISDSHKIDMCLLFGFMGLILFISISFVAILGLIFGLLHVNLTLTEGLMVVGKGLLDNVLSDFLWAKAILLIGPTIATVGLSLQWPIAFVIDILFFHPSWMDSQSSTVLITFGSILILMGFVGINLPESTPFVWWKNPSEEEKVDTNDGASTRNNELVER